MTGQGSWQVAAAVLGQHVHVVVRSPGAVGHRPFAGTLVVSVEDWPALRQALAQLPSIEWVDHEEPEP